MLFNGSNGYINVSGPDVVALASNKPMTLEIWMNLDGTTSENGSGGQANYGTLFESNESSAGQGFNLAVNNTLQIWWWPSNGNDRVGEVLSLNTWYHVVLAVTGSKVSLYTNGVLNFTSSNIGQPAATFFRIGHQSWVGGWFGGLLAEAAVYNYALSSERVMAHYLAGITAFNRVDNTGNYFGGGA